MNSSRRWDWNEFQNVCGKDLKLQLLEAGAAMGGLMILVSSHNVSKAAKLN